MDIKDLPAILQKISLCYWNEFVNKNKTDESTTYIIFHASFFNSREKYEVPIEFQDCTFENESAITEVCLDDYDSNADYQVELLALEEFGQIAQ